MEQSAPQSTASKPVNPGRFRGGKSNLLIAVVSTCVTSLVVLVGAELYFRAIEPKSPPGTTYGEPVELNADGFRDREFEIPRPAGTYRILVLGDSFTWGVGLAIEDALPKLLETALAEESTGNRIEVINASETGANTVEELLLLQNTGLKYDPDMILLIYNLNDIEYKPEVSSGEYEEEDVVPVVEIDPGEDITRFSRNAGLRGFVLKIERRSAFARYMVPRGGSLLRKLGLIDSVEFSWVEKIFQGFSDDNPGWIESRNALTSIAEIADERDIDYVVAIYPLLNELDNYQGKDAHATILQYCRQAGISCVDLLEIFEFANERSYWINYADAHPNAEAHRLVADYLTPIIEERLPE